jgi:glycosyltransferase involved in cell wall biosynthesis
MRKNNPFGLSWNLPFYIGCQREIARLQPDYVLCSVRKQAAYHVRKRIPGVRYLYEVHELCYYPGQSMADTLHQIESEKEMLAAMDQITVTTDALREILLSPPYQLQVPISVVPLAVGADRLPPPLSTDPLHLLYVGQLYPAQGIQLLLAALAQVADVQVSIIGRGSQEEMARLQAYAERLGLQDVVSWVGFVPPSTLASVAQKAHACVAPFGEEGRMPYVAHTKLYEYARWGRPMIAPRLPIVTEHFTEGKGLLLFTPGDASSLANAIRSLQEPARRESLQREMADYTHRFSWQERALSYAALLRERGSCV